MRQKLASDSIIWRSFGPKAFGIAVDLIRNFSEERVILNGNDIFHGVTEKEQLEKKSEKEGDPLKN